MNLQPVRPMNFRWRYKRAREAFSQIEWTPVSLLVLAIAAAYVLPLSIYLVSAALFWKFHSMVFGTTPSRAGDVWAGLPFYAAAIVGIAAAALWSFWLARCAFRIALHYTGNSPA